MSPERMNGIGEFPDLQEYLTEGVERIVSDAVRATLKNPRESAFMLKFAAASKSASKRRRKLPCRRYVISWAKRPIGSREFFCGLTDMNVLFIRKTKPKIIVRPETNRISDTFHEAHLALFCKHLMV